METPFVADSFIGKFLGPNKIASIEATEFKTPSETPVYKVTYEGGQQEMLPETLIKDCSADTASDYTALFLKKFEKFAPIVLRLFTDYGLAEFEVEHAISQLKHSTSQSFNRALSRKWYGSDEQFVEGYDPRRAFTLVEADIALKGVEGAGAAEVHMPVATKKDGGSPAAVAGV